MRNQAVESWWTKLWISCDSMVRQNGQTFPPTSQLGWLINQLCKTSRLLPHFVNKLSHCFSTRLTSRLTVVAGRFSTLSTGLIIMTMN